MKINQLKDNNHKHQPKKRKDSEMIDQRVNIVQKPIIEIETIIKMVKHKIKKVDKEEDITIINKMLKENQDLTTDQNKRTKTQMLSNLNLILHWKNNEI